MKKEQMEWLKDKVNKCDYAHIGLWDNGWCYSVDGDLEELIEDSENYKVELEEKDAHIQRLTQENKRISKLYETAQGGWKRALLEIEALKEGRTP